MANNFWTEFNPTRDRFIAILKYFYFCLGVITEKTENDQIPGSYQIFPWANALFFFIGNILSLITEAQKQPEPAPERRKPDIQKVRLLTTTTNTEQSTIRVPRNPIQNYSEHSDQTQQKPIPAPRSITNIKWHAGRLPCPNCPNSGHRHENCPISPFQFCEQCNQPRHHPFPCNKHLNKECQFCHTTGHIRLNCPSLTNRLCFNCNGKGHIAANCPQKKMKTPLPPQL
ncbi:unnamed protein product [Orchesella dallaii]|uniref:CCHC-type domain-containing protein n=1 Tax=Orchesella dallaii TaxID=48710 RepID=A0ABP1PT80_9HEXA